MQNLHAFAPRKQSNLQPSKFCQRPKAGCHESTRNASTPDSTFQQSAQTREQSAQAGAPSTIASGTSFFPNDSTVHSSFQCNINPQELLHVLFERALRNQYGQR
jgi:hypothetical protein